MQILDNIVCVFLDIHLWTGRKKLRPEDLKVTVGSIPPEKLASLGSKKICDPAELATFGALKKRAERACEAHGIRFLGGYAIPQEKANELVADLNLVQAEFESEKIGFLSRYDTALQSWIADNSEWASIIRAAVEPVETVRRQLRFGHQTFKIGAASSESDAEVNEGLDAKLGTLGDRLIFEISRDAEKAWETSFRGKDKVTQKSLRPLRALLDKLKGLSFLDSRATAMANRIEAGLSALPKHGPIEGQDLNALIGLVLQLADPNGVKSLKVVDWGSPQESDPEIVEEDESEQDEPTATTLPQDEPYDESSELAYSPVDDFQPSQPGVWF